MIKFEMFHCANKIYHNIIHDNFNNISSRWDGLINGYNLYVMIQQESLKSSYIYFYYFVLLLRFSSSHQNDEILINATTHIFFPYK